MTARTGELPLASPVPVTVHQAKILDFIDGLTQRKETVEEYVQQEVAKSLVRDYGYSKTKRSVEITLRRRTLKARADR